MFKCILKDLYLIAMYELGEVSYFSTHHYFESEDDIDTAPNDFAMNGDQNDLNGVSK